LRKCLSGEQSRSEVQGDAYESPYAQRKALDFAKADRFGACDPPHELANAAAIDTEKDGALTADKKSETTLPKQKPGGGWRKRSTSEIQSTGIFRLVRRRVSDRHSYPEFQGAAHSVNHQQLGS
jgi:hypothetical protein